MYYQYPIETLARRRRADSQMEFALEAKRILRDRDDVLFEPLDHGLAIFAANEDALEEPVRILEEVYADEVDLPMELTDLTDGTASHLIRLTHYAPVPPRDHLLADREGGLIALVVFNLMPSALALFLVLLRPLKRALPPIACPGRSAR